MLVFNGLNSSDKIIIIIIKERIIPLENRLYKSSYFELWTKIRNRNENGISKNREVL
jgi:hypothetical protein